MKKKTKEAIDLLNRASDLLDEAGVEEEENGEEILCSLGEVISDTFNLL